MSMVATQLATLTPPMSHVDDLEIARVTQTNVLILGEDRSAIPGVLEGIRPYLDAPIVNWRAGERLRLPAAARHGTLVLDGLDAMTLDDQLRLLEWLDDERHSTRVVSTATSLLRERIDAGVFFEQLYYRLNTVCIDASL